MWPLRFALPVLLLPAPTIGAPLCFDAVGAATDCAEAAVLTVDGLAFRTYDGTGNNLDNTDWGAAGSTFLRAGDADYDPDGFARSDGPSAREVSNTVASSEGAVVNDAGLSSLFWAWGQFIDHDITLTPESHAATMSLAPTEDDPLFSASNMLVTRSDHQDGEQRNDITAFLDGSMVYGSDLDTANSLRALDGTGRLKESAGALLPTDDQGNFLAGDVRANEQQQLIAMHTVFVREHNRIADQLAGENPEWSGERIYQESRAIVGAEIQAVTYNEWLPLLLGDQAPGAYTGYHPEVNPSLTNEFSACAFRFCHSMIPDELERLEENGDPISDGALALSDGFFNPEEFRSAGGVDPLIRGLAQQEAMEVDVAFEDGIRNFLDLGGDETSDLFARNLMRGRDHGLPDYNDLRAAYGLDPAADWADLTDDPVMQAKLRALYGETPDGLDPYLGGLLEEHVSGGIVGALNAAIIVDQFERLRVGDRFWYESYLAPDIAAWVGGRTLSDILLDNTGVAWLQDDAFRAAPRGIGAPGGVLALGILAWAARRRLRRAATRRI